MICSRKSDKPGFLFSVLQRYEQLFRLFNRTAVIVFTVENQQWCVHPVHIFDRRMMPHRIYIIKVCLDLPVAEMIADVGNSSEAHPVGNAPLCDSSFEPVRVTDDPVGHKSSV